MTSELQTIVDGQTVERVLLDGDLGKLTASQRVAYYGKICEALGLNPLTRPFEYIVLNGRLVLYARRECTEQLRKLHKVSLSIVARELTEELYAVTAKAQLLDGRTDESIGVKSLAGLKGDARANAMMTAETKAKRRVTLSICGLGLLDETEVADIPPTATRASLAHSNLEAPMGNYATIQAAPVAPLSATAEVEPDPRPPLADGYVRIERIDSSPTKNPSVTKYFITLSTGEVATTINTWLASVAQGLLETGTPARAETKSTKWGVDLVALKTADEPAEPPLPMLTDEDIPF